MRAAHFTIEIAVVINSLLIMAKLFEIASHAWIAAAGQTPYDSWFFTRLIVKLPSATRRLFARYVFRYKFLMLVQTALVIASRSRVCATIGAFVLLLGLWMEIIRILVDRLVLGPDDSNFRSELAKRVPLDEIQIDRIETSQQMLRRFVFIAFGLATLVVMSYAAVYCAVQGPLHLTSYTNVPADWTMPIHFIYFSLVTVATVGFGDIQPGGEHLAFARLLTGSEIIAAFLVLVVLLTSASMTSRRSD